jgi:hypothetical protein
MFMRIGVCVCVYIVCVLVCVYSTVVGAGVGVGVGSTVMLHNWVSKEVTYLRGVLWTQHGWLWCKACGGRWCHTLRTTTTRAASIAHRAGI